MNKSKSAIAAVSALLLANAAQADAAQQAEPEINAHSVVQNTNLIAAPAYTTVISSDELHANHYKNVAEALSYAPGVTVNPGAVNTGHLVVSIDGDDRTAVLVDGRRAGLDKGVMSGRAAYDIDLLPPVMSIERIEIVHGAAGSYAINYDAPGGLVNIITKKGGERRSTVEAAAGEYGSWRLKASTGGSSGKWSWMAAGGFDNQDYMKYKSSDGGTHEMPNSELNRREMYYRIDRELTNDSSLTFTYGHLSNDTGIWYSRRNPLDYNYEKLVNNFALTYDYKKSSVAPAYITYYHNYTQGDTYIPTGHSEQEDEPSYSRWKNTVDGIDWRDGWRVSKDHTITAGIMYRHTSAKDESTDRNNAYSLGGNFDEDFSSTSAYLQTTRRFGKLTLTGTSLLNHSTGFGSEYVANGALDYSADDATTLYASLGQIYDIPSLNELYYDNNHIKGNRDLRAETGHKGSLGVRHKFDDKTTLNVNGFIENIDDPIGWTYDGNSYRAENFENQKKRGFTVDLQHRFSDKYSSSLSFTRTVAHTDYGDGLGDRTDYSSVAPTSWKAALSYTDSRWNNNLLLTAVSGRDDSYYSGDYLLADLNMNYKISDQWNTYLKLHNITNESYEDIGSYLEGDCPAPGRTALMGVEYSF